MNGILQDWVCRLGLRHQGTLLTAVRGCDTAPKDDPSKLLVRCYREVILKPHCGDPRKAATFIEKVDDDELLRRFNAFRRSCDHYPHHWVLHLVHAVEVVGYKHPDWAIRGLWHGFYMSLCTAMHLNAETEAELDRRLDADEATFAARDRTCDGTPKAAGCGGGMTDFWSRCKARMVPEITDADLEDMLCIVRPVFQVDDGRFREIITDGVDRRGVAYTWGPKLGRPVRIYRGGLNEVRLVTFHTWAFYGFFEPTLAEAYACLRAFVPDWRMGRFLWLDSVEMDRRNIVGDFHWCPAVLFGSEEPDVIDPEWDAFVQRCSEPETTGEIA